jgi:hypothetical protein
MIMILQMAISKLLRDKNLVNPIKDKSTNLNIKERIQMGIMKGSTSKVKIR